MVTQQRCCLAGLGEILPRGYSDRIRPNPTKSDQIRPDFTGIKIRSNPTTSDQVRPNSTEYDQIRPKSNGWSSFWKGPLVFPYNNGSEVFETGRRTNGRKGTGLSICGSNNSFITNFSSALTPKECQVETHPYD